jgi:acetyltransferase-like isoleucine patch superfamily enzyme
MARAFFDIGAFRIGTDVFLSRESMVLNDVKVGDGAIVASNAKVTKPVRTDCTFADVPVAIRESKGMKLSSGVEAVRG